MPHKLPNGDIVHTADERLKDAKERKNVVNIEELKPGVKIEVHTQNSIYTLDNEGNVIASTNSKCQGGKLTGSTWGGSMIWMKRLSPGMYMETTLYRTSQVQKIKIIGDGWEYELSSAS